VQSPRTGQFILYNWLALAQQVHKLLHENAVWANIISSQRNGCRENLLHWPMLCIFYPLLMHSDGPTITCNQLCAKPSDGPMSFYMIGSNWPSERMSCHKKMLYWPTLFQASRMAAEKTCRIGPCYKCSPSCRRTQTGPQQPVISHARSPQAGQFYSI